MDNAQKCIVSIIILTYNNQDLLLDAIDSVISQDYPNIELIISDDGSTSFNHESVLQYVEMKKKSNISFVKVIRNANNVGTVKHANLCIRDSIGKYIRFLAADDILFSSNVISNTVERMQEKKYLCSISYSEVFGENSTVRGCLPSQANFKRLLKMNNHKIFERLCVENFIGGTGLCFEKALFDQYGLFDERYVITEDWPYLLRLFRKNVQIDFNPEITVKYRLGGVSNDINSKYKSVLLRDRLNLIDHEILPYADGLSYLTKREVRYIREKTVLGDNANILSNVKLMGCFADVILLRRVPKFLVRLIEGIRHG